MQLTAGVVIAMVTINVVIFITKIVLERFVDIQQQCIVDVVGVVDIVDVVVDVVLIFLILLMLMLEIGRSCHTTGSGSERKWSSNLIGRGSAPLHRLLPLSSHPRTLDTPTQQDSMKCPFIEMVSYCCGCVLIG